jgi:uncharacterized protein
MTTGSDQPRDPRALCEFLVRRLVDDADAVSVTESRVDGANVLTVHVAEADRGKVIGRQGRVIRALRSIVRAGAMRTGERVQVEIDA